MASQTIFVLACLIAVLCIELSITGRSNCGVGGACNKCPSSYTKSVRISGYGPVKVCCPNCETSSFYAGNRASDGRPYCTCPARTIVTHRRLTGDCWKGAQCATCNNSYTGNINGVSVCCANCQKKGLRLSPRTCNCNV